MGTPAFAVPALEKLLASGHEVAAVYTQPPRPAGRGQEERHSPVHELAVRRGIPVKTPASLKNPEAQKEFRSIGADIALVAAYGLILPKEILSGARFGCINIHPSLLPRWRGAAPIQRTIMAGDTQTGVVIMKMDEGLDTGDMLMIEQIAIPPGTTAGELHDNLARIGAELAMETLDNLDLLMPIPQPENGVTYAAKIDKSEARINWKESAEQILNKILGLSPSPGAYFEYEGERIKVLAAEIVKEGCGKPGEVLDNALCIACGDSVALRLTKLQRAGKKALDSAELLKGFKIKACELLSS